MGDETGAVVPDVAGPAQVIDAISPMTEEQIGSLVLLKYRNGYRNRP